MTDLVHFQPVFLDWPSSTVDRDGETRVQVATWFWYAFGAAILYGLHQVFTKLASDQIGEGLGGFVVEATAALSIGVYLGWLWLLSALARRLSSASLGSQVEG